MNVAQQLRFWKKVRFGVECWEWTAARMSSGYGRSTHGLAHRIAYRLLKGDITQGLQIDHLCRNHSCVNPAHLELVTSGDNSRRGAVHLARTLNAIWRTQCKHGHYLNAENTYRWRGKRLCRVCSRARMARYTARNVILCRERSRISMARLRERRALQPISMEV